MGCHKDRKEKPISAPSIHIGAWFILVDNLGLLNKTLLLSASASNISIVPSPTHIILYDDIVVAKTLFFVLKNKTKGLYSTQKKKKTTTWPGPGLKPRFILIRLQKILFVLIYSFK